MDAKIEAWNGRKDTQADSEDGVNSEQAEKPAFDAVTRCLVDSYGRDDEDDEDEGCDGAGLLFEIVRRKAIDGDLVEGDVAEGTDPAASYPEDCLFYLGPEAVEGPADTDAVHDICDESCWKEIA